MAHLFKPTTTKPVPKTATVRTLDGRRVACWVARGGRKVTAELAGHGDRCRVESPTWWVEYTDGKGKRTRTRGFRDRGATLQLAAGLEQAARDVRAGVARPDRGGRLHLVDHLADFRRHLEDRGDTAGHVRSVTGYVRGAVAGCGLTTPAAVDAEAVGRWLHAERRRLGWSAAGLNRRVLHLRQFGRWLARTGRSRHNPFDPLTGADARGVNSRPRRRLEQEHLAVLIETTRAGGVTRGGLPAEDRAALYLVAAYTGLRRGSLRSLTPESFDWADGVPAAVTARAGSMKNRRLTTLPAHPALAAVADWLRSRPPGEPLWRGPNRTAEVLRADLAAARSAWIAAAGSKRERERREKTDVLLYRDRSGDRFDFHALRVQFVSGLALAGVPLTAAQRLAGHSTPTLTANVYTRWGRELAGEVAKLPGLRPAGPSVGVRLGSAPAKRRGSYDRPAARGRRPESAKGSKTRGKRGSPAR